MEDDRGTSKHLSIFIGALRDVQNTVHLHIVRVKRLIIHLERKQLRFYCWRQFYDMVAPYKYYISHMISCKWCGTENTIPQF